jgi:hypothetical protein
MPLGNPLRRFLFWLLGRESVEFVRDEATPGQLAEGARNEGNRDRRMFAL